MLDAQPVQHLDCADRVCGVVGAIGTTSDNASGFGAGLGLGLAVAFGNKCVVQGQIRSPRRTRVMLPQQEKVVRRCGRSGVSMPLRFHVPGADISRAGFATAPSIFTPLVPYLDPKAFRKRATPSVDALGSASGSSATSR